MKTRPAGLRVKGQADAVAILVEEAILEFETGAVEAEVVLHILEGRFESPDVVACKIEIAGNLEAIANTSLHLEPVILGRVMPFVLAAPVRRPKRELGFSGLLRIRRIDIAEWILLGAGRRTQACGQSHSDNQPALHCHSPATPFFELLMRLVLNCNSGKSSWRSAPT
jgi:hypothetical protein